MKTISAVKAIKFHSEFWQWGRTKALEDDQYQLFLNTQLAD
jgi:hypothetical protein